MVLGWKGVKPNMHFFAVSYPYAIGMRLPYTDNYLKVAQTNLAHLTQTQKTELSFF